MSVGRNDPCPCGSHRKFKHCCGAAKGGGAVDVASLLNTGGRLLQHGDLARAESLFREVLQARPRQADALHMLGLVEHQRGNQDAAAEWLEKALAAGPASALLHYNLGKVRAAQGRLKAAAEAYGRAVKMQSDYVEAHTNLANALIAQGEAEAALAHYRQVVKLRPTSPEVRSTLLLGLHYPEQDPDAVYREHLEYDRMLKGSMPAAAPGRQKGSKLRIGYVSPDFRQHSVAHFIEPVLQNHDRSRFEILCFYCHPLVDELTTRMQAHADEWHSLVGMGDAAAADLIRSRQVDVLVDLAGHTLHNRLPIFARKPAPVQVTWLGYPDTTGLSTMDYRLTDERADPPGTTERFHSETLVRLPQAFSVYGPPREAPELGPLPAGSNGHVTFGSLNNFTKMSRTTFELWAELLRAVEGSRLLLKARELDPGFLVGAREKFAALGVTSERIDFFGPVASQREHLERYHRIDIALDPFPYNGTTTTCEALWMGVPTVSLAGMTHVSRVGASLLGSVGLSDLVAGSGAEYVAIAAGLAGDLERLAALRTGLRERMLTSPLTDAVGFTRRLEAAYERMGS